MTIVSRRKLVARRFWKFRKAPETCGHLYEAFFDPIDAEITRKRCRACGADLFTDARCQEPTKSGRQCLLAAIPGDSRCRTHGGCSDDYGTRAGG